MFKIKPFHIEAFDLQDAWFQAIWNIFEHGRTYTIDRGSFEGQQRLEYDFITINISNPGNRPLVPIVPAELGIDPPTSNDYVEDYFTNYLMSPEISENEQYTYGQRILVSLDKVIEMLKKTPQTNQAIIEIGKPEDIFLPDPPCLRILQFKVLNNKLVMYVNMRSNDLWGAFSANLAGFQLIKEFIGSEIDCEDGAIMYSSQGLHLYDYVWDIAKMRVYKNV